MEISQILIFVILGAIMMMVVTGGALSMMGGEAEGSQLAGGAMLGGALGAAASYLGGADLVPSTLLESIGGAETTMKVGLPNF
jgi:hypothetical protein